MPKTETFGEKVKRHILEENKEPTTTHDKPKQQLQKVVSHEIKELPALYSATFQNKPPPKESDPVSFIIPCIIGNHSMRNALADLGASISAMPYSLFKRLGLGSLKPIKMTIEMTDKSMQSPKGIKENVLVKISNFVFPVDFIILDIMEDENVLIILGRPMLATAHAKIYVYGKKISLGVESVEIKEDFSMTLCDPDKRMSIGLEEFVDIDDMWDDLDQGILTNEKAKTEFLKSGGINMVGLAKHLHVFIGNHQFLVDFIILENISEFVEKGLTEVLFGYPFKEQIGLVEDRSKGTLWFKSIFLDYRVTLGFDSTGGLDLACPIIRLSCQYGIHRVLGRIYDSIPGVGTNRSPHLSLIILKKHRNSFRGGVGIKSLLDAV
ncbi:hypothetical protein Tco_0328621 [Tanacetum coccineum]